MTISKSDSKFKIHTNSAGYQQVISTLTAVGRQVSEQKFYTLPPADFMPIVVGNGSYQNQIINWRSFSKDEGFDTGVMQNAANSQRLSYSDASFDEVPEVIYSWAKGTEWNTFQLEQALKANNLFSIIEAKEVARRKSWDLGIQKAAFLGYGSTKGYLNQSGVTADTGVISVKISTMSTSQFNTFLGALYQAYRANANYTAKPTHFSVPESDYNALLNFPDSTYPLRSRLDLLEDALKRATANQAFKVLPNAYGDKANNGTANNIYVLSNYDETSLKMDLPLDYTMTAAGTVNSFTFENAAYGQFSEVVALRPAEMIYFTNTAS